MKIRARVDIMPSSVEVNGQLLATTGSGMAMLNALYRAHVGDYPKYFKMDPLCRLGFVASELLLQTETPRLTCTDSRAVILFSRSGSIADDRQYQQTIQHADSYFPSPAVFVYTLPNIVTGEIAIRNRYWGETSCYQLGSFDMEQIGQIAGQALLDPTTESVVFGWVDCSGSDCFEAHLMLAVREE